ncbi:MAG: Hsp20/alpha crystallin family protein [Gemmatimonadota bacterium]
MSRTETPRPIKDENPRQGASGALGRESPGAEESAGNTGDREQSISRESDLQQAKSNKRNREQPADYTWPVSRSPFSLFRRLTDDMERMFDDVGFGRRTPLAPPLNMLERSVLPRRGASGTQFWSPHLEVRRRGDDIIVRADLPGIRKEDVSVDLDDGMLTISGERSDERTDEDDGYFSTERGYGSFHRTVLLPDGVEADSCDASFKDGVLEVKVRAPKEAPRTTKRIAVKG